MPLINCEIELQLTWSKKCVLGYAHDNNANLITNTATLGEMMTTISRFHFNHRHKNIHTGGTLLRSIEGEKLLRNLERGFSKTINWNKLTIRETTLRGIQFDVMIEPTFQGVNRLFILCYTEALLEIVRHPCFYPTS